MHWLRSLISCDDEVHFWPHPRVTQQYCADTWQQFLEEGINVYSCKDVSKVTVYKCPTSPPLYVKQYHGTNKRWRRAKVAREYELVMSLSHPQIVKFVFAAEQKRHAYLFMEDAGVRLDKVSSSVTLSEDECRGIMYQLVSILVYVHEQGVVHRDIKPENVGIASNNVVRLFDFGESFRTSDLGREVEGSSAYEIGGTAHYMAPEALAYYTGDTLCRGVVAQDINTCKLDIWSLGCVAFFLLSGKELISVDCMTLTDILNISRLVAQGKTRLPRRFLQCSSRAKDFVMQCLQENPAIRPSIQELMGHAWFDTDTESALGDLSPRSLASTVPDGELLYDLPSSLGPTSPYLYSDDLEIDTRDSGQGSEPLNWGDWDLQLLTASERGASEDKIKEDHMRPLGHTL